MSASSSSSNAAETPVSAVSANKTKRKQPGGGEKEEEERNRKRKTREFFLTTTNQARGIFRTLRSCVDEWKALRETKDKPRLLEFIDSKGGTSKEALDKINGNNRLEEILPLMTLHVDSIKAGEAVGFGVSDRCQVPECTELAAFESSVCVAPMLIDGTPDTEVQEFTIDLWNDPEDAASQMLDFIGTCKTHTRSLRLHIKELQREILADPRWHPRHSIVTHHTCLHLTRLQTRFVSAALSDFDIPAVLIHLIQSYCGVNRHEMHLL